MPETKDLVQFLKKQTTSAGLIDRLKISYHPLICPFDDLLKLVEPGANVLDIGCGAGQFLTLVAEFTEAKTLAGLEISAKLIKQAETLLKAYRGKLKTQLASFDGLHFPPFIKDFDTVFLIDVLHHIPGKRQFQFLSNLYRSLEPGTTLILKDIDAASLWVYFNKFHDLILSKEIGHELSLTRAEALVQEIGFKIQGSSKKRLLGYPHYTLVLTK